MITVSKEDQEKFYVDRDPFKIYVPNIYKKKFDEAFYAEIDRCESIDNYDPYGFKECNRMFSRNRESFRQKSLFLIGMMYYLLKPRVRAKKGTMLCVDFSEHYLSNILGDCSRNRTRIGWKTIKQFLLDNEIIEIADKTYIHDSKYGLEPQSMGWTLFGLKDLKHKPFSHEYKNGRKGCTCKKYTYEDFLLCIEEINDPYLLKSLSKNRVRYIRSASIAGTQAVMLTHLAIDEDDYRYLIDKYFKDKMPTSPMGPENISIDDLVEAIEGNDTTVMETISVPTEKELNKNEELRKDLSNKFLRAVYNKTPYELTCHQSVKTSRIYTGLTSLKKELRPYLYVSEFPEQPLVEIDAKSSQVVMLAALYYKNTYDREPFEMITTVSDIYSKIANRCNFIFNQFNPPSRYVEVYTRDRVKSEVFKFIFSNRYTTMEPLFQEAMTDVFGKRFMNFVRQIKGRKHTSRLAKKLQELEARIYVGGWDKSVSKSSAALCKLYKKDVFALSIHDSIVVMEKDIEVALLEVARSLALGLKHIFHLEATDEEVWNLIKTKKWVKPTRK